MFIEDGSGLSPLDAINSKELAYMLLFMKNKGKYFAEYFDSLADAGKEGTLKRYFQDPVFDSRFKGKRRVNDAGKKFCRLPENIIRQRVDIMYYSKSLFRPSQKIISGIEEIIRETILYK